MKNRKGAVHAHPWRRSNKMGKFKNKLYRFMYGRNGSDTLGKFLLGCYIALVLIYSVVTLFIPTTETKISAILMLCYILLSSVLIVMIFHRMFSKNVFKRRQENQRFCGFFKLLRSRRRDRKTHVYRKCPKCRAVLRLPKAKGKHSVICPRCRERFQVRG